MRPADREHHAEQLLSAHRTSCERLVAAAAAAKATALALERTMPTTGALRAIADAREAHEAATRAQESSDRLIEAVNGHRGVQSELYPEADRGVHVTGARE